MTFLNPLLLLGLAAAAIPILIHLLNLRKLNTIEFSSLRFLKELQKSRIRRLKIRQLLLLILRTLLVILVVLSFSRPTLKGTLAGSIGTKAKSTMVILLDDSPSMSARNENGVLFTQAKKAVENLLELVNPGDEIYLLKLSDIKHTDRFTPVHSRELALTDLASLLPSQETVSFREAAGAAAKILAESENINHEIYIMSDGQASQFKMDPQDTADILDATTRVFHIEIPGMARAENLGIASVSLTGGMIAAGKPLMLEVVVQNTGNSPANGALASIYLDGSRVVQQTLDISSQGSTSFSPAVTPMKPGVLPGYVQLEDDVLDFDNRRHFAIHVPEKIRVTLAGTEQATRFPGLALSAVGETGAGSSFSVERVEENRLSSLDVSRFDVLLACDIKDWSSIEADRLTQFVQGGGGIALFAGDQSDIPNLNTTLLRRLGVPPVEAPAEGGRDNRAEDLNEGFLSFGKVDLAHPLFGGLFEEKLLQRQRGPGIESPQILKALKISKGRTGNALIELSDGTPFLAEFQSGLGRVLMFAVDPGVSWSDFAIKGIYAPLLHRCAVYLAAGQTMQSDVVVGAPVAMNLRLQNSAQTKYILTSPSGLTVSIIPRINPITGLSTFVSSPSREIGLYVLTASGDPNVGGKASGPSLAGVAINLDPGESMLRQITAEELTAFFSSLGIEPGGISWISSDSEITRAVLESRFGVELWKYLIGGAILLALCEMAVARATRSERSSEEEHAGSAKGA